MGGLTTQGVQGPWIWAAVRPCHEGSPLPGLWVRLGEGSRAGLLLRLTPAFLSLTSCHLLAGLQGQ